MYTSSRYFDLCVSDMTRKTAGAPLGNLTTGIPHDVVFQCSLQMHGLLPAVALIASYNPAHHFAGLQAVLGDVSPLSCALIPLSAAVSVYFSVAQACQDATCASQGCVLCSAAAPRLCVRLLSNRFLRGISGEAATSLTAVHTGSVSFSSGKCSRTHGKTHRVMLRKYYI